MDKLEKTQIAHLRSFFATVAHAVGSDKSSDGAAQSGHDSEMNVLSREAETFDGGEAAFEMDKLPQWAFDSDAKPVFQAAVGLDYSQHADDEAFASSRREAENSGDQTKAAYERALEQVQTLADELERIARQREFLSVDLVNKIGEGTLEIERRLDALNERLGSLIQLAERESPDARQIDQGSADLDALAVSMHQLTYERDLLKEKVAELEASALASGDTTLPAGGQEASLQEISAVGVEAESLRDELADTHARNARLQEQIEEHHLAHELEKKDLYGQIDVLREEQKSLETDYLLQLEQLEQRSRQCAELTLQAAAAESVRAELDHLREQLQASTAEHNRLEAELADLTSERDYAKTNAQQCEQDLQLIREQLRIQADEHVHQHNLAMAELEEKLRNETETLALALEESSTARVALESALEKLEKEFRQLTSTASAQSSQSAADVAELEELRNGKTGLLLEAKKYESQLAEIKTELSLARTGLHEAHAEQVALRDRYESETQGLKRELLAAVDAVDAVRSELNSVKLALGSETRKSTDALSEQTRFSNENDELKARIKQREAALAEANGLRIAAEAEQRDLSEAMAALNVELEQAKEKAAAARVEKLALEAQLLRKQMASASGSFTATVLGKAPPVNQAPRATHVVTEQDPPPTDKPSDAVRAPEMKANADKERRRLQVLACPLSEVTASSYFEMVPWSGSLNVKHISVTPAEAEHGENDRDLARFAMSAATNQAISEAARDPSPSTN